LSVDCASVEVTEALSFIPLSPTVAGVELGQDSNLLGVQEFSGHRLTA